MLPVLETENGRLKPLAARKPVKQRMHKVFRGNPWIRFGVSFNCRITPREAAALIDKTCSNIKLNDVRFQNRVRVFSRRLLPVESSAVALVTDTPTAGRRCRLWWRWGFESGWWYRSRHRRPSLLQVWRGCLSGSPSASRCGPSAM